MNLKNISRNKDIIDNEGSLEQIFKINQFPLSMGCVDTNPSSDIRIDQIWSKGINSGVIQLELLAPLELLYQSQHDAGVVGALWMEHHEAFASFIKKRYPSGPVLEIGGAHGILSKIANNERDYDWTIIEPAPNPAIGVDAKYIKGFFGDTKHNFTNIKCMVHSHVFEHLYNPIDFLKKSYESMDKESSMYFAVPNIFEMVERGYSNSINFEHTIFLCEEITEYLFKKQGFNIIEKEFFKEDHSIFYHCKPAKHLNSSDDIKLDLPKNYTQVFKNFWHNFETDAKNLNNIIKDKNNPCFIFGAHIFSQILLRLGLDESNLEGILDNAESKRDKRLYGSELMVDSPSIIKDIESPYVVLRAGAYNAEITKQLKHINPDVVII